MLENTGKRSLPIQPETLNKPIDFESVYQNERSKIRDLYKNVWVWHGTGRYTQTENGIIDTLDGILNAHGVVPNQDFWNGLKVVHNVSATVSRPYATRYSDFHLKGKEGNLVFWDSRTAYMKWLTVARQIVPPYLHNSIKNIPSFAKARQRLKEWRKNHKAIIPDDYPILIGFKSGAFEPIKTEKYLEALEVRTDKTIPIERINHLEVPMKFVKQTEDLLREKGVSIPVISRELGERYQTEFSSRNVVLGKAFSKA